MKVKWNLVFAYNLHRTRIFYKYCLRILSFPWRQEFVVQQETDNGDYSDHTENEPQGPRLIQVVHKMNIKPGP